MYRPVRLVIFQASVSKTPGSLIDDDLLDATGTIDKDNPSAVAGSPSMSRQAGRCVQRLARPACQTETTRIRARAGLGKPTRELGKRNRDIGLDRYDVIASVRLHRRRWAVRCAWSRCSAVRVGSVPTRDVPQPVKSTVRQISAMSDEGSY